MAITGEIVLKEIKSYLIITLGIFLYVVGWISFMIPQGLSGGGVTGISAIINFATNGYIEISYSYLVLNAILITTGTIILGKGFGAKTIYSIVMASVMFKVLPYWEFLTTLSDIPEPWINAVISGTLSAFGVAAIFFQGGSTGGTDVIALILNKYSNTSPGKGFMYCDLVIIGSVIFLPGKGLQDVVYGYIQMVSFTYMLDSLLYGSKQSIQMFIFSGKYQEVGDMLLHKMRRGVTALDSVGWYSQQPGKVLVVVARKSQINELTTAIKEVDPKAFISVTPTASVYGQGFDTIKEVKINTRKKAGVMSIFTGSGNPSENKF
ncbi:MAG: YitT family protein [Bacteroidales bacterium]|nr:YitT family protein [Bacteroidales bacterium]